MFTQPAASPTTPGLANVSSVSPPPASPTRTSRLRGLSLLRNYTQTHLLSREPSAQHHQHHHQHNAQSNDNQGPAAAAASAAAAAVSLSSQTAPSSLSLSSAAALPPQVNEHPATATSIVNNLINNNAIHASSGNNPSPSTRSNRFSQLLPTLTPTHPLALPPPPPSANPFIPTDAAVSGSTTTNANTTMTNTMTRARSATTGDAVPRPEGGHHGDALPSIRFSAFHDQRANRPSLKFPPIARTLPTGSEVIRVGRYSERDNIPNIPTNVPSSAPVGFKSKVVSRRHCEFWCEEGKWYIKDVKSSSGTFLNHIRLSAPGQESKPFPVNDGDIVQLGIDFKGGEEMIFRCVKMRLELNRGWQNKLNAFNLQSHKRLRNMTTGSANDSAAQSYSQDCSICLNTIAPCQCLFVAPCSHTWHYKCIKSLLNSPSFPNFICPNCRAAADLDAEVEELEDWEQLDSDEGALLKAPGLSSEPQNENLAAPRKSRESVRSARHAMAAQQPPQPVPVPPTAGLDVVMTDAPAPPSSHADATLLDTRDTAAIRPTLLHSNPTMPIRIRSADGQRETRTPSPTGVPVTNGHEGPITPRNDAGPWVFDGSGVRLRSDGGISDTGTRESSLGSLEAAVQAAGNNGSGTGSPQDNMIS